MGLIFRDSSDDQIDGMMRSTHYGLTWTVRLIKIKAMIYGAIAVTTSITATAVLDYCIIKWTEHAGIIGWILG